jgi:hypothetical protein
VTGVASDVLVNKNRVSVRVKRDKKEPDRMLAVLQDQPALGGVTGEGRETKLLVEGL